MEWDLEHDCLCMCQDSGESHHLLSAAAQSLSVGEMRLPQTEQLCYPHPVFVWFRVWMGINETL